MLDFLSNAILSVQSWYLAESTFIDQFLRVIFDSILTASISSAVTQENESFVVANR